MIADKNIYAAAGLGTTAGDIGAKNFWLVLNKWVRYYDIHFSTEVIIIPATTGGNIEIIH